MRRKLSLVIPLLALACPPFSDAAIAGPVDAGDVIQLLKRTSPVEKAQDVLDEEGDYCWYDSGWSGPGWYLCGDAWDDGLGWGGSYGWNGWGGYSHRRHRFHGAGARGAGSPGEHRSVQGFGGPGSPGLHRHRSGATPEVHAPSAGGSLPPSFNVHGALPLHNSDGANPALHHFGSANPNLHSFGSPNPPVHNFGGGEAPLAHGFGGGGAPMAPGLGGGGSHGFSGGGGGGFPGFSGGGGSFHSGGGHR